jgi:integrase
LFNHCRELGFYEGDNPVDSVDYLKEPRTRLRHLEAEEEVALLEKAKEPLRTIILVGTHAGLRIGAETRSLRRSDFDLKRGLLTVQAAYAKNGTSRTVDLRTIFRSSAAGRRWRW